LIVEIYQIVRSEHMAAEGDPVAETNTNYIIDSLPVPLLLKKKTKGREECKMLEVYRAFRLKSQNGLAVEVQTLNRLDSDKFFCL